MAKNHFEHQKKTRTQINRSIRAQLRRATLTPLEKKLRRAILRQQTGIHLTRAEISLVTSVNKLSAQ